MVVATEATKSTKAAAGSSNPLRVFKNRDYALYFGGQMISQTGTWMQQIALSWLTYKLTNSALLLAVVGMSTQLPSLLVMPYAGVMADRFNRHRIVFLTQVAAMLQAALLAYLTMTHQIQIWHLIVLGIMSGVIAAFDMPVRSAFVMNMVSKKEDLPAAIAMNSSLMNLTRLLGPAVAGFVVAALGEGVCFLINAASYIAVIAALMFIRGDFEPKGKPSAFGVIKQFTDGVKYVSQNVAIRSPILWLAIFGFGGFAYGMLLPVFVKQIGGNANTLGYLSSASAFGSVLGTAILAMRKSVEGMGKLIVGSAFLYGVALFAFGFARELWTAMALMAVLGAAMMLQIGCCNTLLQSVVEDDKRGRVMSLFTMAFMGTIPFGSLVAGFLTNIFGFQAMILCCAVYCVIVTIIFASRLPAIYKS
jgi:MFS family permease